jgi:hypothetical protein
LAAEAFHIRLVGAYFLAMLLWRAAASVEAGASLTQALLLTLSVAPIALFALGVLLALAWANSRTTVYTITNRRVVMRFGAAVPKAINIPFRLIKSAALDADRTGGGQLALTLTDENRIAFLHLWPHVRPFRFAAAVPTFRGVPDAAIAAGVLAEAVGDVLETTQERAAARAPSGRALRSDPAHA